VPLALAPVVLLAGSAAHAWWTSTGSGSAQVGAATAAPLVVTASTVPSGLLHPGASTDLRFALTNPNAYTVELTTLTAVTVTSSKQSSCPGTHLVLPAAVVTALAGSGYPLPDAVVVPPGPATASVLADLVTLSASAPDACQGVQFTVSLTFSGAQA
jgi:hypothetical protein